MGKDQIRKTKKRQSNKDKMTDKELEEKRILERIRIRNYREKKKQSLETAVEEISLIKSPYQIKQATGKVLKRLAKSLPNSPRKK